MTSPDNGPVIVERERARTTGLYPIDIAFADYDRTRPLIDKKLLNVDFIPIALREDQTRLPPALADRFAVQVTPPSPFTFELPEDSSVTELPASFCFWKFGIKPPVFSSCSA